MCSIFGSFSIDKIRKLAALNSYRGQHSYSYSYYDPEERKITYMRRNLGTLPIDEIDIPEGQYCIAHMQAPTTSNKTYEYIHPAGHRDGDSIVYLWHNGIIKEKSIKEMQERLGVNKSWDTYLILYQYYNINSLNNIDGTFSCVYYQEDTGLKLFRNEISPLFIDKDHNISSTKFDQSTPLKPNIIWRFNPGESIIEIDTFNTVENPYFFTDTL